MYTIWALVISIWIGIPQPHIEIKTMKVFTNPDDCLAELHRASQKPPEQTMGPRDEGFWLAEKAWATCIPVPHNLIGA